MKTSAGGPLARRDRWGSPGLRFPWVTPVTAAYACWAWIDVAAGRRPGWPELVGFALLAVGLVYAAADLRSQGLVRALTRGPTQRSLVALTYDDGPDPRTTPIVLATLAAHGVRATFFVVASKAAAHSELVANLLAAGHEVASHGDDHRWQTLLGVERARRMLARAGARLTALVGTPPRFFRPPYGVMTPALARALAETHLQVVGWTARAWDTCGGDAVGRARRLAARARPGSILLLHDAPEHPNGRLPLGPAMTGPLLSMLAEKGLRPVPVGELLASSGESRG